jgi:dihydroxy-acid dehydratase
MKELLQAGILNGSLMSCTGKTIAENIEKAQKPDNAIIRTIKNPLKVDAGFLVLRGNLFDAALIKTSVISPEFRKQYLSDPADPNAFVVKAIVFDGPEDYHDRINQIQDQCDPNTLLVIRGCGTLGFPGSGEVVNMLPPDRWIQQGIGQLPTLGDGRQSGTSASPSILNASPEALALGGLAKLQTGDLVRIDLNARRVDALVDPKEWERRENFSIEQTPETATPWQYLYRQNVGQLHTGGCLDFACSFRDVCNKVPRHNH